MGKPRKYSLLLPVAVFLLHTLAAPAAWSQPFLPQPTFSRSQTLQEKLQAQAETSMRLIGTAICPNLECSVAVIVDEGNRMQKFYHEGDMHKTVHIKEIHADRIVIDKGNGDQVLRIGHTLRARSAVTTTTANTELPPSEPRRESARQRSYVIDRGRLSTAGQEAENPTDTILVNESRLFNRKNGLKITSTPPGSIYQEMGLRPGDLLLDLNGQEIATPEDLPTFIRTIQHDKDAELTIRRRARTYHLTFQLQ